MILSPAINLSHRVVRRVLDIPRKGLPVLHSKPLERGFDQQYGVETSNLVWLTNPFSKNFGQGCRYEAANPLDVQWAIEKSGIDTSQFTFVDVGCGKGRPLIVASTYAFPKLIGVEYSSKLCKQAGANLKKCNVSSNRFRIACQDATTFTFPDGDLFAFFYNPFAPPIIRKVLDNLKSHKGRLFVSFTGQFRHELENHSWLKKVNSVNSTALYEKAY